MAGTRRRSTVGQTRTHARAPGPCLALLEGKAAFKSQKPSTSASWVQATCLNSVLVSEMESWCDLDPWLSGLPSVLSLLSSPFPPPGLRSALGQWPPRRTQQEVLARRRQWLWKVSHPGLCHRQSRRCAHTPISPMPMFSEFFPLVPCS